MRASPPPLPWAGLVLAVLAAPPAAAGVPAGFTERVIAQGLDRPVPLAAAPDGTLYIGEQYSGAIRVWRGGTLLPDPFVTVSPVYGGNNETGLLGLAVSPDYLADRQLYVFVTSTASKQRVLRYTNVGDRGLDETVVVDDLPTRGVNHDGGGIAFGPDAHLYLSVGDNAVASTAPDPRLLSGKLLRFRRDGGVPTDNPWPGSPVWAVGLRNTFRFTFQPGTGKVFGTENGPFQDDELNVIRRGAHHGWPDHTGAAGSTRYVDPIAVYSPTTAVTGIAFHDGTGLAALTGSLLVAHYKAGVVRRLALGGPDGETVVSDADFVTGLNEAVDVVVGADGAVYCSDRGGRVIRVSGAGSNVAPFASFTARPSVGRAPLVADLDATGSGDVDGRVTDWSWDLGANQGTASGPVVLHTYAAPGTYAIRLTVRDDRGATGTTRGQVTVLTQSGDPPPSAHIEDLRPATGKAPLKVRLKGHGHDNVDVVEHRWDFGDRGAPEIVTGTGRDTNSEVEHEYGTAGDYTVTLTVRDDQGSTGVHTRSVTVSPGGCHAAEGMAPGGASSAAGALAPWGALLVALGRRPRRRRAG
ncbi:MAG: PQQ-dependent sugar dehydrogenase [Planctomycetes bacterium]|nr:PQQ-dependent sugar dehydrogenase [Planctomycetota bacterium]